MPSAAHPSNGSERMATLKPHRVLDTMPDTVLEPDKLLDPALAGTLAGAPERASFAMSVGRCDRLAALAAQHFAVPVAVVSLIDAARPPARPPAPQWFTPDLHDTHRGVAIYAQATLQSHQSAPKARPETNPKTVPDTVMVIEDTTKDPRFADGVAADGKAGAADGKTRAARKGDAPAIRFYAGAPIMGSNGKPLGALSIIDYQPRTLDQAGRQYLSGLAANAGDLLELHLANLALAQAATRDPLTGLANRNTFEGELETAMESAFAGRPFALLYIDVDGFKPINERHGHDVGDEVLRQIGQRLSSSIRASDFPARIGGDEFAIILTDPASHDTATRVARRLIADLGAPILCQGVELSVTASVGCALALRHGTTAAEVRRAADEALYMAKRSGRNQLVIADEVVSSLGDASYNSIEQNLAKAIEGNDLKLQWQPYFQTGDGQLTGYEALVRWTCPGLGPVQPSTFIPVAEASGLIGALDEWVLRQACSIAVGMPDDLTISVNLSAYWFSRGELVRLIRSVLHETGLPPHRLILELTERTIITHTESARQSMDFLRSLGVCFALDDFGTSYSSLNYLRKLPFDTIKLDRSFVIGLGSDPQAEAVAGAIIHLGHALGMKVCAEGVETVQQMDYLTDGLCDLAQGYLLGHPEWQPLHLSGVRNYKAP